jgi:hypothetical protein
MTLPVVAAAVDVFGDCVSTPDPDTASAPDAVLPLACWLDAPAPAILTAPDADDAWAACVDAAEPVMLT